MKSKSPGRLSEDALVVCDDFVAVIDGATSKGNLLWNGKTSGRLATETLCGVVAALDRKATLSRFIKRACFAIRQVYDTFGRDSIVTHTPAERLSASVAVYSDYRHEVWLVGDCQFLIDGKLYSNPKSIDKSLAVIRSDINRRLLFNGSSVTALRGYDVGRKIISDALRTQCFFQNDASTPCEYSYCAIDGFPLPNGEGLPESARPLTVRVPRDSRVAMATDGYPRLFPTLQQSEERLALLLAQDPLCVRANRQTKGMEIDAESYDDRAFVAFYTDGA